VAEVTNLADEPVAPPVAAAPPGDPHPTGAAPPSTLTTVAAVAILGGALWAVYGRAIDAPFIFDDRLTVMSNPSIGSLSPLVGSREHPGPLRPPENFATAGRPLVNLSLAVNYHFAWLDPRPYHLLNLALHASCAVLVFLVTGNLLRLPSFDGRMRSAADLLALLVALLFALHPLQTEAVEYVTQRTELMVALFYLSTLFASQRYWAAAAPYSRATWLLAAWLTCLLGMACKEVMVTAPVVVLLYERTFISGSFRGAIRASWPLYLGFVPAWALLLALNYYGPRASSAGFHLPLPAYVWWYTQAKVLLFYIRLTCWPWPQSIHHEIPYVESFRAAAMYIAPTLALAVLTLWLCWRRSGVGFALAWVLIILSPTLVVPIITEVAAERRMYLPLAAIAALAVVCGYTLALRICGRFLTSPRRWPLVATAAIGALAGVALGASSMDRLRAYRDAVSIWEDAHEVYPHSTKISTNLASELLSSGRLEDAISISRQAIALGLADHAIHNNLGSALVRLGNRSGYQPGQLDEAIANLHESLTQKPDKEDTHVNLAFALLAAGKPDEAVEHCRLALAINPHDGRALYGMGTILMSLGRRAEARQFIGRALEQNPDSAEAHYSLGQLFDAENQPGEAAEQFRAALRIAPNLAEAHNALGTVLARSGAWGEAARHYAAAVELQPDFARAWNNWGVALMNLGETESAIEKFERAVRAQPDYAEATLNLQRAHEMKQSTDAQQPR
jgi:protein O-mannosyl-transferase